MTTREQAQPQSNGAEACLELRNISMQFGKLSVLENISMRVAPGEWRGILGPNGAGKTTLFNIVSGELAPVSGSVYFYGRDITRLPSHRRAALGISRTFQITSLFPQLTVLDNLVLSLQALSHAKRQFYFPRHWNTKLMDRAMGWLEQLGLQHQAHQLVKNLSYGEQRQLEIALALAQEPKLLLLDEPTAGLAQGELPLVMDILRRVASGITVVLIEHDMSVVFQLVEKLTVLDHGQVVAEGTPDEIRANAHVQEIYLGGKV